MSAVRPRRLRQNVLVRDSVGEFQIATRDTIQPYFVKSTSGSEVIDGFSGIRRHDLDSLSREIEADVECGLRQFLLFGAIPTSDRDATGSQATAAQSILPSAIETIRRRLGNAVLLYSDVCLCPYTDHGHCGLMSGERVDNDRSWDRLAEMAVIHAQAGVDFVAPSDMMDGRIGFIRRILEQRGYRDTGILAYTAKYHSNYYGPFREALGAVSKGIDRSTYQMDYRNTRDAVRELKLDLAEGADLVMVKPALAYLDIIQTLSRLSDVPVVAYSVSAEYEMVKRMASAGLVDERNLFLENLTAMRRAGAKIVVTYAASEMARRGWLR